MGFLNRLFRREPPKEPAVEEDFEYEEPPEDPTLQALEGPRYALSQILTDFEEFGLYELGKKPRLRGAIHDPSQLERALYFVANPPDGRRFYLAAKYKDSLVLFHR